MNECQRTSSSLLSAHQKTSHVVNSGISENLSSPLYHPALHLRFSRNCDISDCISKPHWYSNFKSSASFRTNNPPGQSKAKTNMKRPGNVTPAYVGTFALLLCLHSVTGKFPFEQTTRIKADYCVNAELKSLLCWQVSASNTRLHLLLKGTLLLFVVFSMAFASLFPIILSIHSEVTYFDCFLFFLFT